MSLYYQFPTLHFHAVSAPREPLRLTIHAESLCFWELRNIMPLWFTASFIQFTEQA